MARLTPPVEQHPERIVEDVYAHPPQSVHHPEQDFSSRNGFEAFLEDRLRPETQPKPGGRIYVPGDTYNVTRFERKGWMLKPRWALIGALVLTGAVNLLLNKGNIGNVARDGVELAQGAVDHVEDLLHVGEKCHTVTISDRHFETIVEPERVGSSEPSQAGVQKLVDKLLHFQKTGKITGIHVEAMTSDEWLDKKPGIGLGAQDKENTNQLAPERLMQFLTATAELAQSQGLDLSNTETSYSYKEVVLSQEIISDLQNEATGAGFDNIDEALKIFNENPDELPPKLHNIFDTYFGENRGVKVIIDYEEISLQSTPDNTKVVCNPDGSPEKDHDYDWKFYPIPLLPIPKLRKKLIEKVRGTWVDVPPEMPNPEFLKLYPEAQLLLDELSREAWAYARKYQNLFRETDRIQGVYKLDYHNEDGEAQCLRAMFIDHEPTPETVQMVAVLLQTISQIQGGRVGLELDMIAIYPSDNAGLHDDPKKVGLGLDIQRDSAIRGIAYPNLSLVEMHMPAKPSEEDINNFGGAKWVLAHEIAGHFTDLNEDFNHLEQLRNVGGRQIYSVNNRFVDSAQDDFDRITDEEARQRRSYSHGPKLRWHIRRGTQMLSGKIEPRQEFVETDDPRLTETIFARIGRYISRYGRTDAAEHYAESAANIATGIGVPFDEEPEAVLNEVQPLPGYADTYSASRSMHALITNRWGSDPNADFAVFPDEAEARQHWRHWYGKLEDSDLYPLAEAARNHPLPSEEDLLWIITGTRIKPGKK